MVADIELNSVIVAEDDGLLRGIFRSMLMGCGFEVLLAADGVEAVDLASSAPARLVILDVKMPNLDGIQACRSIRAIPGYDKVPIVMLSGYGSDRVRASATQAGASLFLSKPISDTTLRENILPLLGIASNHGTASFEWKRAPALAPARNETPEQARGRKLLEIQRRYTASQDSRRPDWFR